MSKRKVLLGLIGANIMGSLFRRFLPMPSWLPGSTVSTI